MRTLLASLACLVVSTIGFGATVVTSNIIKVGDTAPGTAQTITELDLPVINNVGELLFRAVITDPVLPSRDVIYLRGTGGAYTAVAQTGDPVPTLTGVFFSQLGGNLNLADDGYVSFVASVSGAGVTSANDGLVLGALATFTPNILAREGDLTSLGIPYGASSFPLTSQAPLVQLDNHALFSAILDSGTETANDVITHYYEGATTILAREGVPAPGTNIAFIAPFGIPGASFASSSLTPDDQVGFYGQVLPASGNYDSLALFYPGFFGRIVVMGGEKAPGFKPPVDFKLSLGGNLGGGGRFYSSHTVVRPNGNPPDREKGIFGPRELFSLPEFLGGPSHPLRRIFRVKDKAAGEKVGDFGVPMENRFGRMQLHFFIPRARPDEDTALGVFDGKINRVSYWEGSPVAGPNLRLGGFDDNELGFNAAGNSAKIVSLVGSDAGTNDRALVHFNVNGDVDLNLREGQIIDFGGNKTLTDIRVANSRSGGADGRPRWFNDRGQIAALADFQGGGSGIILCNNDTEPVYQPDAMIVTGTGAGDITGDNIYPKDDPKGDKQRVELAPTSGATVSVIIRVQNDSTAEDSITVTADASAKGYTVVYKVGGVDVTAQITGGGYLLGNLAVGASQEITMEITATADAHRKGKQFKVTATSNTNPTSRDKVYVKAKVN